MIRVHFDLLSAAGLLLIGINYDSTKTAESVNISTLGTKPQLVGDSVQMGKVSDKTKNIFNNFTQKISDSFAV